MSKPRVALLIDLPRGPGAGGHVKYWERATQAAARHDLPVDVTVYFPRAGAEERVSADMRYCYLPPVFSTEKLKFLPYVPAHTDLAPFHPALAQALPDYDLIHTTDAYFAFARTAERLARWNGIPLITSFHTDTPAYAELFTRQTVDHLLGKKIGGWAERIFKIAARERAGKEKRLLAHLQECVAVAAMRAEDKDFARRAGVGDKIKPMRLAVDKALFAPERAARADIEARYGIPSGRFLVLFVGRVDAGKNAHVLAEACDKVLAQSVDAHLLIVGQGPMERAIQERLGDRVSLAGVVRAEDLARIYASADVLAMASDIEIGGMIGLEALACGCPVLVSRASDVAQLCGQPAAMQQVDSGVDAWARALLSLAGDATRCGTMRCAALAFRDQSMAGWDDVLMQDFAPLWRDFSRRGG